MARPKRAANEPPVGEQILEAAGEIFSKFGYENASVKDIAALANMTAGAIYYHYANKQALFFACLLQAVTELVERCESVIQPFEDEPKEALREFARQHIEVQFQRMMKITATYTTTVHGLGERESPLNPEQQETLREWERRHVDNLRKIIQRGVANGDFTENNVSIASFAILGMCEHAITWIRPDGPHHYSVISKMLADYSLRILTL